MSQFSFVSLVTGKPAVRSTVGCFASTFSTTVVVFLLKKENRLACFIASTFLNYEVPRIVLKLITAD
jgi:hypothetical protein